MNIGKVPGNVLKRSVVNLIGKGPRTGVDSALMVQESGMITLASTEVGLIDSDIAPMLAVIKACNNIRASHGTLMGVQAAFVISDKTKERALKNLTRQTMAACRLCNTELTGGHTEVSDGVNRPMSTVTAIGYAETKALGVRDIRPGMGIVMTKWAGLEEAAIILNNENMLNVVKDRFSPYYMGEFEQYTDWLSIEDEAAYASEFAEVIMHDNSDGGVFGSLWDMAEGSGLGFKVTLRDIPVRQEIIELGYLFNLNVYRMKSSGSLMLVCEDAEGLTEYLNDKGIPASYIGFFTDNNDKIILVEDEVRYLERV